MLPHRFLALIILPGLSSVACAEPVVVSFSDLKGCEPCRQLEAVWRSKPIQDLMDRLERERLYVDAVTSPQDSLRQWGVDRWPTTFLVEMNEERKVTRIYRRHVGTMTVEQLSVFVTVPQRRPR